MMGMNMESWSFAFLFVGWLFLGALLVLYFASSGIYIPRWHNFLSVPALLVWIVFSVHFMGEPK